MPITSSSLTTYSKTFGKGSLIFWQTIIVYIYILYIKYTHGDREWSWHQKNERMFSLCQAAIRRSEGYSQQRGVLFRSIGRWRRKAKYLQLYEYFRVVYKVTRITFGWHTKSQYEYSYDCLLCGQPISQNVLKKIDSYMSVLLDADRCDSKETLFCKGQICGTCFSTVEHLSRPNRFC